MVQAALRAPAAAAAQNERLAPPSSPGATAAGVALSPPLSCLARVPAWADVARQQADINERTLKESKTGDYFAMDDRNLTSMPWRRVFVVRDGDHFLIYDSNGYMIHEPNDGVEAGRQAVDELIDEFDANEMWFYRQGKIRKSPHRDRQQSVEAEPLKSTALEDVVAAAAPVASEVDQVREEAESENDAHLLEANHPPPPGPLVGGIGVQNASTPCPPAPPGRSSRPTHTLLADSCECRHRSSFLPPLPVRPPYSELLVAHVPHQTSMMLLLTMNSKVLTSTCRALRHCLMRKATDCLL